MKNPSANLAQSDSKSKTIQPKHLSSNRKGLLGKVLVVGLVLAGVTAVPQLENRANDARANGSSDKVVVYLSAPQVMGSGVTEAVQRATFDDLTVIPVTGAPPSYSFCPNELAGIGPITFRESPTITAQNSRILPPFVYWDGICAVDAPGAYGGASTDTSVRAFGGTATRYMKVPFYDSGTERSITFELASAAKYVGFWWSGGNAGNLVRFMDANDNLVAEIDSADIQQILGGANTATPTGDVVSRGGTAYSKSSYRGNPVYYSDLDTKPTTGDGTNGNPFIYTYLNLFVEGSLGITKVQFAGPGFEFDNLAFSTVDQTPDDTMVLVIERNSPALTWTPVSNLALSASPATPSQLATKSGNGTISYSVKNPGTTGCTVNSTTGVISYTAVGDCVVTATVTGTNTYLKSTKDVTFTITNETNENGNGGGDYTPVAETNLNPCQAISGVENVTRKAKSFSGFAINSAVLTKAMKKEIRSFLRQHPKEVCVSVAGFTMGPRVLSTDAKLAKDRAKAVRTYIKSLRPDAAFTKIKWSTEKRVGNNVRRAKVTLRY